MWKKKADMTFWFLYIYVKKPKGAQFSDSIRKTIKNTCSDSTRKMSKKIVKIEQKI